MELWKKCRIGILFLAMLCLITGCSPVDWKTAADTITEQASKEIKKPEEVESISTEAYAYQTLDEQTKKVYDEVLDAILKNKESVAVSTTEREVLDNAYNAVNADYGGLFWVSGYMYTQHSRGDNIIGMDFSPSYTMEQSEREEIQAQINAVTQQTVGEQMQSDEIQALIASNTELQVQQAISEAMSSDAVQAQLSAAAEGAKSVIALKSSLDSYNAFYLGLITYTSGVSSAAAGANELKTGADALKAGTSELSAGAAELLQGIQTMKDSAPALVDGITQLRDGSMELSDGLKQFNEEGIQKLIEAVDGDLDGLSNRIRVTADVAKHYTSFSGISEDMDGDVKFIYKTDSIG